MSTLPQEPSADLETRLAAIEEGLRRLAAALGMPVFTPQVPAVITRGHLSLLPPA